MAREHLLNVSGLEPPEPLERALAAAEALAPGEYLRLLHRRDPVLLYPMLLEQGFTYEIRSGRSTAYEILIWRRGDAEAEQGARAE